MKHTKGPRVVIIGGGTGSSTILAALRHYCSDLVALVNMSDDGGSTGRLRQDYGVLPAGDIRQCLTALANHDELRQLFEFRFSDGSLGGHAFGNVFIAALEKVTGNFKRAVDIAAEVLRISGKVEPITLDNVTLCMRTSDGAVVKSEVEIGHTRFSQPRPMLWLEPEATISDEARAAIMSADMVVIAPGNLYGSLAPALIVGGVLDALTNTGAKCVYVCNLATKAGQTDDFNVQDFADEIERLVGGPFLDSVLYNNAPVDAEMVNAVLSSGERLVVPKRLRFRTRYELVGADLLGANDPSGPVAGDPLASKRTLLKHDPGKVAAALMKLLLDS